MSLSMHPWMNTKLALRRRFKRFVPIFNFYAYIADTENLVCFVDLMDDPGYFFQMFGMSKIIAERSSETKEVESSLPLKTTVGN